MTCHCNHPEYYTHGSTSATSPHNSNYVRTHFFTNIVTGTLSIALLNRPVEEPTSQCMFTVCSPLGPFVPAPPEVAMRMFRDQGGPSPFDGGRNGRSGHQVSGPAPVIALPPTFRQDPRNLRRSAVLPYIFCKWTMIHQCSVASYNDLDAQEDEVTVIDYRSL
ncbi:unnamed protein product [Fraxinus pennsylvanica]|uniref:Uncharacterized protein n=1 Tax=Fraxinus pennsylvanica TaxID=56036 RepID=A0AAD1Z5E2_9LAMI|nr:unnamed protein product [Fraxinus pennsylvanica]